ncbi:hypothetical protein JQ597_08560 [Bradyrhizobium sp. AUGA SZCCT0177]|uniref:hypothetical protein n=1 Tax=Bradyrhizobium sp. AUGA SZCCT0177 TaxID=2807665 RepID=UPI001BAC5D91|nr:hypothetical protein [Bradyrhizobium sp. AUGA SZCCT0177]MBR1282083.1 hypothetical protein [Bradyrhizobium sp. AUGA SZCCT0177]
MDYLRGREGLARPAAGGDPDAVSDGGCFMFGTVIGADIELIGQRQPHWRDRRNVLTMGNLPGPYSVREVVVDRGLHPSVAYIEIEHA